MSKSTEIKEYEWNDKYDFPRDLVGYGENSFNPQWPNGAKIAVSFVINYEEVSIQTTSISHASSNFTIREEKRQFSTEMHTARTDFGRRQEVLQGNKNEQSTLSPNMITVRDLESGV